MQVATSGRWQHRSKFHVRRLAPRPRTAEAPAVSFLRSLTTCGFQVAGARRRVLSRARRNGRSRPQGADHCRPRHCPCCAGLSSAAGQIALRAAPQPCPMEMPLPARGSGARLQSSAGPIKCGSNQVRVQSSAGRTEGECPRPISCWSVPARGHASNCLASSRHPACACPVVASPRRTGPTPRRRQRAIEPAIAAAMRRIERGLGSSQGPQKRAIRGRIVAGVEWLGGRVKTRFAPFEAGWRGCARAPAACRGGRVPPQFCRLKTAESCADEAKTLVFSGSDLC